MFIVGDDGVFVDQRRGYSEDVLQIGQTGPFLMEKSAHSFLDTDQSIKCACLIKGCAIYQVYLSAIRIDPHLWSKIF
ncbi:MAG: hypothetical protein WC782_08510 [Methylococcaceae bacterium]|jgi:hypothetical protein